MDFSSAISKYVDAHERGLLSAGEFANSFLFDAAELNDAAAIEAMYLKLPSDLRGSLKHRLDELRENDFAWTPVLFGSVLTEADISDFRNRLEFIDKLLLPPESPNSTVEQNA